jgi:hypothetical protein
MDAFDAVWDEDRGGPRTPHNYISIPTAGNFFKATAQALPWQSPGAHDDETVRRVIASIYVEQIFRRAPVRNPPDLDQHRFLTTSLGVDEYLNSAMELLLEEGLVMLHAGECRGRPADESLRSMNLESESLVFWRVRFMNQGRLESQIHESGRAGESWLFTGFMNLSVASVTRPNSAPSRTHTPGTSPTQPVRRSGALAEGAPRLPQISKPYQHPHRPSDANSHLWRHMREAHRHVVFGTLVVEHRLQPRLGRIERHAIPSPLNSIEDILYELAHHRHLKRCSSCRRQRSAPRTRRARV